MSIRNVGWGMVAAAVVAVAVPADARNNYRWEHLGSRSVKLSGDRDVIGVRRLEVIRASAAPLYAKSSPIRLMRKDCGL